MIHMFIELQASVWFIGHMSRCVTVRGSSSTRFFKVHRWNARFIARVRKTTREVSEIVKFGGVVRRQCESTVRSSKTCLSVGDSFRRSGDHQCAERKR